MLQMMWLWWSLSLRAPDMLSAELSSLNDMLGLVTQVTVKSSPATRARQLEVVCSLTPLKATVTLCAQHKWLALTTQQADSQQACAFQLLAAQHGRQTAAVRQHFRQEMAAETADKVCMCGLCARSPRIQPGAQASSRECRALLRGGKRLALLPKAGWAPDREPIFSLSMNTCSPWATYCCPTSTGMGGPPAHRPQLSASVQRQTSHCKLPETEVNPSTTPQRLAEERRAVLQVCCAARNRLKMWLEPACMKRTIALLLAVLALWLAILAWLLPVLPLRLAILALRLAILPLWLAILPLRLAILLLRLTVLPLRRVLTSLLGVALLWLAVAALWLAVALLALWLPVALLGLTVLALLPLFWVPRRWWWSSASEHSSLHSDRLLLPDLGGSVHIGRRTASVSARWQCQIIYALREVLDALD